MGGMLSPELMLAAVTPRTQPFDPLARMQQMQSLRNMGVQNQLGQQQIQSLQMENQLRQMQLRQQQLFMQAMASPDDEGAAPAPASAPPANPPSTPAQPQAPPPSAASPAQQPPASFDTEPSAGIPGAWPVGTSVPLPQQPEQGSLAQMATPGAFPAAGAAMPAGPQTGLAQMASPPGASQLPAGGAAPQPQGGTPRNNFADLGDRMSGTINRFLKMGGNPMFAMDIYNKTLDMRTKLATLSKDELDVRDRQMARAAGVMNSMVTTLANTPAEQQPGVYRDLLRSAYENGSISQQTYQAATAAPYPGLDSLKQQANGLLLVKDQNEAVLQNAQVQYYTARGKDLQAQADSRNLGTHASSALATMPTDPSQVSDWLSNQPQDIQKLFPAGERVLPGSIRQTLQNIAVPTKDQPKFQQEQLADAAQSLGNAYDQGGPTGYARALGNLEARNPDLAKQFPSSANSSTQIRDIGLTAEQRSTEAHRQQEETQRQQQITIENKKLDLMAANHGLTPGQQGVQNRFEQREWNQIREEEDKLHGQRVSLYGQLQTGKDANGKDLDAAGKSRVQGQLDALNDHLANVAERKGEILGLQAPSADQAKKMKEGDTLPSNNPAMVWKKMGGIVYPIANPQPQTPAAPARPAAAAPPAPSAAPQVGATRTLTQDDVDRLARSGYTGFRPGQTVRYTGTGWQ